MEKEGTAAIILISFGFLLFFSFVCVAVCVLWGVGCTFLGWQASGVRAPAGAPAADQRGAGLL